MLLVTRADLPTNSLNDFIAHLRANGSNMQYASAGFGSPTHLACALLNSTLGIDIRHVAYRGGSPATRDLLAGKADYFCSNVAAIKPHIEAGRLKALAVFSRGRVRALLVWLQHRSKASMTLRRRLARVVSSIGNTGANRGALERRIG